MQISVGIEQAGLTATATSGSGTVTVTGGNVSTSWTNETVVLDASASGSQVFTITGVNTQYNTFTVNTTNGTPSTSSGTFSIVGLSSVQSVPNVCLEQITIGYDTSDPLKPRLYINGVDVADSSLDAPNSGSQIDLVIQMTPGCNPGDWYDAYTHVYTRTVGDYMAIGLDASRLQTNC